MVGTQRTCRAYPIRAAAIECEKARVGGRIEEMDIGRVIELDELELPELGEHDLRLKILAVSAEPDIPHATPAATVDIHHEIDRFEDLPRAISGLRSGRQSGIPISGVATDLRSSLRGLC